MLQHLVLIEVNSGIDLVDHFALQFITYFKIQLAQLFREELFTHNLVTSF